MATVAPAFEPRDLAKSEIGNLESSRSAISWAAIVGGAVAAVSASLVLVALGSAFGFASVSPWDNAGVSLTGLGVWAAIWLVVTQWLASAFGGYLTGRLRTKWAALNSDEVFFRDTAHGFLAWGLSTVVAVWIVMSAAGGAANVAATVGAGAAQGATQGAQQTDPMAYYTDSLFRSTAPAPTNGSTANTTDVRGESARILGRAMTSDLAPADRTYVAQLVSSQTGLSQADAETRVDDVVTAAKQDADAARKAAAAFGFITALSLLIGAFVASAAGALGGRHRDEI